MTWNFIRKSESPLLVPMAVGIVIAVALVAHGQEKPTESRQFRAPGVKVDFGGKNAPLPQVPQGSREKERETGEGEDSSIAGALKNYFTSPSDGEAPAESGAGGDAPSTESASSEDDSASEDSPEGEEGEEKDQFFKKIVGLFQGKEEAESSSETDDESYRKIKELERLAERDFKKERYAEAKKNLNGLITLKPYDPGYHFALGLVFRKEGRYQEAMKKYQDVLDLGGPKPLIHLVMAEAVVEKGDTDKVFEHLKEAAIGGRNIIHDVGNLSLLSDYRADTEFIKLALSLEKYDLISKKSQDPMTQEFARRTPTNQKNIFEQPTLDHDEPLSPEEQQKLLSDARKAYDRVLWFIKLEDEGKAMENYIELRNYLERQDQITIPKIQNDFRHLATRMEPLEAQIEGIRLKFYYNQALVQLKKMKEAFQEGEFQRVKTIFEEVKKLAREMERTNARYTPVAERILAAGNAWIRRTEIREEFNSRKPSIQGIIMSEDAKKAIINNRIYDQGEQFDDFLVQKVENNRITFRYKGEEIPLVFRRY